MQAGVIAGAISAGVVAVCVKEGSCMYMYKGERTDVVIYRLLGESFLL